MMAHPPGWCSALLGELITLNPKTEVADSTLVGFVPMQGLGTSMAASLKFEPRKWLDVKKAYTHFADGDVLLAKITPCFENGKAGIACHLPNGLGAGSSEFFVCRPKPGAVEARYLLAWFNTRDFRARAESQMTGSVGHKRVPKEFLLGEILPLAPLDEQQRISDKLDTVFARVDACRERLDRVAPTLKRLRSSVLAAATSGALSRDWRELSKSAAWQAMPLGKVVRTLDQGWSPKCETVPASNPEEWAVIKTTSIQALHFLDFENKRLPDSLSPRPLLEIRPGDVLITRAGPRARAGVACLVKQTRRRLMLCDKAYRIRVDERLVRPEFLNLFLNAPDVAARLDELKTGISESGVNLTQERFLGLSIDLPSLEEQAEIVRRVEALMAFGDRLEARLQSAQESLTRLEPSLLAKAFRGELVSQDPADEPASELPARLLQGQQDSGEAAVLKRPRGRPKKAA